jgi:hypothetical protein
MLNLKPQMTVRYQYSFIFSLAGVLALYGSAAADKLLPVILLANVAIASFGVGLTFLLKKLKSYQLF